MADYDLMVAVHKTPLRLGKPGWVFEGRLSDKSFDPSGIKLEANHIFGVLFIVDDHDDNGDKHRLVCPPTDTLLYIDGTQLGADKPLVNLVLSDTGRNLSIGSAGTSWYFHVIIDEVAIFNIKLEEQDIQTIMNKGLSSTAVGLFGKLATTWATIKTH